jgi:pyrroloquinoline quinone (PQQ) biosynthesis protein C
MRIEEIIDGVRAHRVPQPEAAACGWRMDAGDPAQPHYVNRDDRLGIDFTVEKLLFADLQTLDPRYLVIAPGALNEKHRHAHESIFVVMAGEARIVIGDQSLILVEGGVAFVPRWVVHQTINLSPTRPLKLLAITDFGLTSAVLGDYDARTRLKSAGADAFADDRAVRAIAAMSDTLSRLTPERSQDMQGYGARGGDASGRQSDVPETFVDALAREALEHRAVCHPYLASLASGVLPDLQAALADFASHYCGYSAHFPRYLTAVISRLEQPAHRAALLANLTEESGQYEAEDLDVLQATGVQAEWIVGIPHPELFLRFCRALGVGDSALQGDHIEVVCWRESFLAVLTSGSPAEAIGALGLGTETIVRSIYRPFVTAIERLGTLAPADAVFFPLHTAVDDHHQATLRTIAIDFAATPQGRADLRKGMRKALALRDSFWGWLHQRALSQPRPA